MIDRSPGKAQLFADLPICQLQEPVHQKDIPEALGQNSQRVSQPVVLNEDHIAVHGEGCVFPRIEVIGRKRLAALLRQIAQGHEAVLLDANLTESVSRLISDGPFAERIEGVLLVPVMVFKVHFLTSLRAGRQVVVSPFTPYWFSKCPFWPFFRKFLKNIFFAAHAALLSFCWDGHSFQNEGAGSGSPRRRSAGNDKKRPHRHKSLYGRFGAVQYGNCR